jgi:predicted porin
MKKRSVIDMLCHQNPGHHPFRYSMKKRIIAMSVSALLVGTANAQSSVTLYGIVSGGVSYLNNVQTAATSGSGKPVGGAQIAQMDGGTSGMGSGRWGLKGVEDLGGDLTGCGNTSLRSHPKGQFKRC